MADKTNWDMNKFTNLILQNIVRAKYFYED